MFNAAAERSSPTTIGRYELLGEIARGGMAILYLARELGIAGFEKLVVLKRMLPELAARKDMLAMFLDEARIAALLQHPNLPHTYELVQQDGEYFFVMEYLHGADLRQLAGAIRGAAPLEHAISIAIGLCAGLHYAHERRASDGTPMRLVHRDVSPRNVFVTYDGTVKLLDFGIAQAEQNRSTTATGAVKGTLRYMSPEQVHAGRVDRRSDIFAASIVLWEITVGRPLFEGESDYAVMNAIADKEPRTPSSVRAGYPPALEAIVMKGLRRDPDERFQTAEELQLALEQFAREHQLATSSVGLARFMRETFSERVHAFDDAREHGTLVARALEDASTRSRESESPVAASLTDTPPRRTRVVASDRAGRGSWRWVAIALAMAGVGSAIAWKQLSSAPATPPIAPPASAELTPTPPVAPPPSAEPAQTSPSPALSPSPPPVATPPSSPPAVAPTKRRTASATKTHVRPERHDPHKATPASKTLTHEDLDAAFPPKP